MSKNVKYFAMLLFVLLASSAIMSLNPVVDAQETAEVIVVQTIGGTVDPPAGTYSYEEGEEIVLTATPEEGYEFRYWVIQGIYVVGHNQPPALYPQNIEALRDIDPEWTPQFPQPLDQEIDNLVYSTNPLTMICGYGYTLIYQAVFTPTGTPTTTDATVVVLSGNGGTTNPTPGTYVYAEGTPVVLTATPSSGFEFQYWVATTTDVAGHDTLLLDNPTDIDCQAGYTYSYQPVFTPSGEAGPADEGIPDIYFYAIIIVLVIIAVIGIGAALMYRSKK